MKLGQRKLLAHSYYDLIPIVGAIFHALVLGFLIWSFLNSYLGLSIGLGFLYSYCVTWNINCISHNFIHNPFFRSRALNIAFSLFESLIIGFSQTFYHFVHLRHHTGNNDRIDSNNETFDWMSLYRYGKDGQVESAWSYAFLGFFRGNPIHVYKEIYRKSPQMAVQGGIEYLSFLACFLIGFYFSLPFMFFFLPFYYLGHVLSSLNGYYEHFGSSSENPLKWGVSSYGRLYNFLWFNNGYHAEHHYRSRVHWKEMKTLHESLAKQLKEADSKVIHYPHQVGFLEKRIATTSTETIRAFRL